MKSIEEIMEIITNDLNHMAFGLCADFAGLSAGQKLEPSHQWLQDWQDCWGEFPEDDYNADPDHPYNEELGCWDDGELSGTCTIGIDADMTADDIEELIDLASDYIFGEHTALYLVGGSYAEGGYDMGESIIWDAEVVSQIR